MNVWLTIKLQHLINDNTIHTTKTELHEAFKQIENKINTCSLTSIPCVPLSFTVMIIILPVRICHKANLFMKWSRWNNTNLHTTQRRQQSTVVIHYYQHFLIALKSHEEKVTWLHSIFDPSCSLKVKEDGVVGSATYSSCPSTRSSSEIFQHLYL